jgi:predicted metal-binding protein
MTTMQTLEALQQEATILGASASAVISSRDIRVKDELAALCNGEYTCPNYGLAASCPPHVKGPAAFQKWQAQSRYAIVVKIDLATSVMFSQDRHDVMKLLHVMVAGIERKAIRSGLIKSKAFAGGSCKKLFCNDQKSCCVVKSGTSCRHMESARPSMSGFGIDVARLMASCGWSGRPADIKQPSDADALTWVAGLILLA